MANTKVSSRLIALSLAGNLLFLSVATPLAQAAVFSPSAPQSGQDFLSKENSGFFNPHELRSRLESMTSVIRSLKAREDRQSVIKARSLDNVQQNIEDSIKTKFANKEEFEAEMERRRKSNSAIFGGGGEFKFVKYKDGKKVWFKAGQVSRVENEKVIDAHKQVTTRNMDSMRYDSRGLLISYSADSTDANGHKSTTRWYGATYTDDSVAYGGEGTKYRKLIKSYTEEVTDDRGNVKKVEWQGGSYNDQNKLTSYIQTTTDINGRQTVTHWNNATYDSNGQITSFHESTINDKGLTTERQWSGGTYIRNSSYIDGDTTPGMSEYLLTGYQETYTDERGQQSQRTWHDGIYNQYGDVTSYEEETVTTIKGVQLVQKKIWSGAEYNEKGQLEKYREWTRAIDGQVKTTDWQRGTYDSYGRVSAYMEEVRDQNDNVTRHYWAVEGNGYDDKDRLVSTKECSVDARGSATVKVWHADSFDSEGRVLQTTESISSATGAKQTKSWSTTSDAYDRWGQVHSYREVTTDAAGNGSARVWSNGQYDERGQVISYDEETTNFYGGVSSRHWSDAQYDVYGRVLSYVENRRDQDGNEEKSLWTNAIYDDRGNLLGYHEEYVNMYGELSVKDFEATSQDYNRYGELVSYSEVVTGYDGIVTTRQKYNSQYDHFGRLRSYEEDVTISGVPGTADVPASISSQLSADEIDIFLQSNMITEHRTWKDGAYDSEGHLSGFVESVTTGENVVHTTIWSGVSNERGELIHSQETKSDSRGLEVTTQFNAYAFDDHGRAVSSVQQQIFSDQPSVLVITRVEGREFDRYGAVLAGKEIVTTGGTTKEGRAFSQIQTNHMVDATVKNGAVVGYRQVTDTVGTDDNLTWITNKEEHVVTDMTRTGYKDVTVTFEDPTHPETSARHEVALVRQNITRTSSGLTLTFTDTITDPAQGPAPTIVQRIASRYNERGELIGSFEKVVSPKQDVSYRVSNEITFNLRGQQLTSHEKSLDVKAGATGAAPEIEVQEKWRKESSYDALGRLVASLDEVVSHDKKESQRIRWQAKQFNGQQKASADTTRTEHFSNEELSGQPTVIEESKRQQMRYNALGQLKGYQEKLTSTDKPSEAKAKEVSQMTYDVWGTLATYSEHALTQNFDPEVVNKRGGDLTTETVRSNAQFDAKGRLVGYQEMTHELGRSDTGSVLNRWQSHVRSNITYNEARQTQVLSYDEQVTSSANPALLETVHRDNISFGKDDLVTEYKETNHKTGVIITVAPDNSAFRQSIDVTVKSHRSAITVDKNNNVLSYKENIKSTNSPEENITWKGSYDEKNRLISSDQHSDILKNGQIDRTRDSNRSQITYNNRNQVVASHEVIREQQRTEEGEWSVATSRVVDTIDTTYDSLGQVVSYDQTETRSDVPQKRVTHFSDAKYDNQGRQFSYQEQSTLDPTNADLPFHQTSTVIRKNTQYDALGQITGSLEHRFSSDKPELVTIDQLKNVTYDHQGRQFQFEMVRNEREKAGVSQEWDIQTTTVRTETLYDADGRISSRDESTRTLSQAIDVTENSSVSNIQYNSWGEEMSYEKDFVSSSAPEKTVHSTYLVTEVDRLGRATYSTETNTHAGVTDTIEKIDIQRDALGRTASYHQRMTSSANTKILHEEWAGSFDIEGRLSGFHQEQREEGAAAASIVDRSNITYSSFGQTDFYTEDSSSPATGEKKFHIEWKATDFNSSGLAAGFEKTTHITGNKLDITEHLSRSDIGYLRNGFVDSYTDTLTSSAAPDLEIITRRTKTGYNGNGLETTYLELQTKSDGKDLDVTTKIERTKTEYDKAEQIIHKEERSRSDASPNLTQYVTWDGNYSADGTVESYQEVTRNAGRNSKGTTIDQTSTKLVDKQEYDALHRLISNHTVVTNSNGENIEQTWAAQGFDKNGNLKADTQTTMTKGENLDVESTVTRKDILYNQNEQISSYTSITVNSAEPEKEIMQTPHNFLYNQLGQLVSEDNDIVEHDLATGGKQYSSERNVHLETTYDLKGRVRSTSETTTDQSANTKTTIDQNQIGYDEFGFENSYSKTIHTVGINGSKIDSTVTLTHQVLSLNKNGLARSYEDTRSTSAAPDKSEKFLVQNITYNSDGQLYSQMKSSEISVKTKDGLQTYRDFENRTKTEYDSLGHEIKAIDEIRRGASSGVVETVTTSRTVNGLGQEATNNQVTMQTSADGKLNIRNEQSATFTYNEHGQVKREIKDFSSSATPGLTNHQNITHLYDPDTGVEKSIVTVQDVDNRAPPVSAEQAKQILDSSEWENLTEEQQATLQKYLTEGKEFHETLITTRTEIEQDQEGRLNRYVDTQTSSLTPDVTTTITHTTDSFNGQGLESEYHETEKNGQTSTYTHRENARYNAFGQTIGYKDTITDDATTITRTNTLVGATYNDWGLINSKIEDSNADDASGNPPLHTHSRSIQTKILYDGQGRTAFYHRETESNNAGSSSTDWKATSFDLAGHPSHIEEQGHSSAEGFFWRKNDVLLADASGRAFISTSQGYSTTAGDYDTVSTNIGANGNLGINSLGQSTYFIEFGFRHGLGNFTKENVTQSFDARGNVDHSIETLKQEEKTTVTENRHQEYDSRNQLTLRDTTITETEKDGTQKISDQDWKGSYDERGRLAGFDMTNDITMKDKDGNFKGTDFTHQTRTGIAYNSESQMVDYVDDIHHQIRDEARKLIQDSKDHVVHTQTLYDDESHVISYHEEGTRAGETFNETYTATEFTYTGEATTWERSGTIGVQPFKLNQSNSKFDVYGRLTNYQQSGVSGGQIFYKKISGVKYAAGQVSSQHEINETDAGISDTDQTFTYDSFGRLKTKTMKGTDAQGSVDSTMKEIVYDLAGKTTSHRTESTNALGDKTTSTWTAGLTNSDGVMVGWSETQDVTDKDGQLISHTETTWSAKEFADDGTVKKSITTATKTNPDKTKETTTTTNGILATDQWGVATHTKTDVTVTKFNDLSDLEKVTSETTSSVERNQIERYSDADAGGSRHAGRIKSYVESTYSSDKPALAAQLVRNITYDAQGAEYDSEHASFASSLVDKAMNAIASVMNFIFGLLSKALSKFTSILKSNGTMTEADKVSLTEDVSIPGPSVAQVLHAQDYSLDFVKRTNGSKDSLGRFTSWTETTLSSLAIDKKSETQVTVTYDGRDNEYATFHSVTTERTESGTHIIDDNKTSMVYEDGKLISSSGDVHESAIDAHTGKTTTDRTYHYEDKNETFDSAGRVLKAVHTITKDSASPELTRTETSNFTYNAVGQISKKVTGTDLDGSYDGHLIDKHDDTTEEYTYSGNGRITVVERTTSSSGSPGTTVKTKTTMNKWDSYGRTINTSAEETTTNSKGFHTESWTDEVKSFDASGQSGISDRTTKSTDGSVTTEKVIHNEQSYDLQGRLIQSQTSNTETRTLTRADGTSETMTRTWSQLLAQTAFDGFGQATGISRVTTKDSDNPRLTSHREDQTFNYDAHGRAASISTNFVDIAVTGVVHSWTTTTANKEFNKDGLATAWSQVTFNDSTARDKETHQESSNAQYDASGNLLTYHSSNYEKSSKNGFTKPHEVDNEMKYDDFHRVVKQKENDLTQLADLRQEIDDLELKVLTPLGDAKADEAVTAAHNADLSNLKSQLATATQLGFTSETSQMTYNGNQLSGATVTDGLSGKVSTQTKFSYNHWGQRTGYTDTDEKGQTKEHSLTYNAFNEIESDTIDNTDLVILANGSKAEHKYRTVDRNNQRDTYGRVIQATNTQTDGGKTTVNERNLTYDDLGRIVKTVVNGHEYGDGLDLHTKTTTEVLSFDSLGRAATYKETSWKESEPLLYTTESGTYLYGTEGKVVGTLKTVTKLGGGLDTEYKALDLNMSFNIAGQATSALNYVYGDQSSPDKRTLTVSNNMTYDEHGRMLTRDSVSHETGSNLDKTSTSSETYHYDSFGRLTKTDWVRTDSSTGSQRTEGDTTYSDFDQFNRARVTTNNKTTITQTDKGEVRTTSWSDEHVLAFDGAGQAVLVDRNSRDESDGQIHTRNEKNVQQTYDRFGQVSHSEGDVHDVKEGVALEKTTKYTGKHRADGTNKKKEKQGKAKKHEKEETTKVVHDYREIIDNKERNSNGQITHSVTTTVNKDNPKQQKALPVVNDSYFEYDSQGLAYNTITKTTQTDPSGKKYSYQTTTTVSERDDFGNASAYDVTTDQDTRAPKKSKVEHFTNAQYKNGVLVHADVTGKEKGIGKDKKKYSTSLDYTVTNDLDSSGEAKNSYTFDRIQQKKLQAHRAALKKRGADRGTEKEDYKHTTNALRRIAERGWTSSSTDIEHDEHGNVVGQTTWDATSNQTVLETDRKYNQGRLLSFDRTYVDSSSNKTETVTLKYDNVGQIKVTTTKTEQEYKGVTMSVTTADEVLERDGSGRVIRSKYLVTDLATARLATINIVDQRYDAQSRVSETKTKTIHRINGRDAVMSVQTKRITGYDELDRVRTYQQTQTNSSAPGLRVSEKGTTLYGKDGQVAGAVKSIREDGRTLHISRQITEIYTRFDAFGRVISMTRNDRNNSATGSTNDVITIRYFGAGPNNTTTIRRGSSSGGNYHTQNITITTSFNSSGLATAVDTTIVDSFDPGKVVHMQKRGIHYDGAGREVGYTETTRGSGSDGSSEEVITTVRSDIHYNSDGLVIGYTETNKDVTTVVKHISYDSSGKTLDTDSDITWGDQSTLAPGTPIPPVPPTQEEIEKNPELGNPTGPQPTLNGGIPGLTGDWTAGSVSIHQAYQYDQYGRISGVQITGTGIGTSGTLQLAAAQFPIDIIQSNFTYDERGHMTGMKETTHLLERYKYFKTKHGFLGRKKKKEYQATGLVERVSEQRFSNFDAMGRATDIYSSYKTSKEEWGWTHQTDVKYDLQGRIKSATVESFTHTYGAQMGRKYTADIHSKKEQTFEYYDDGRLKKTNDVKVIFDEQDVQMSGGGFFASSAFKIASIVLSAVLVATGVGTLVAALIMAGINMMSTYYQGASPTQMWQALAINVAVVVITQGMGDKGGSSQAAGSFGQGVAQVAVYSAETYAVQRVEAYAAKRLGAEFAMFLSAALMVLGDELTGKADQLGTAKKSLETRMMASLLVTGGTIGLGEIAKRNKKSDDESNWFSAMLDGLASSISGFVVTRLLPQEQTKQTETKDNAANENVGTKTEDSDGFLTRAFKPIKSFMKDMMSGFGNFIHNQLKDLLPESVFDTKAKGGTVPTAASERLTDKSFVEDTVEVEEESPRAQMNPGMFDSVLENYSDLAQIFSDGALSFDVNAGLVENRQTTEAAAQADYKPEFGAEIENPTDEDYGIGPMRESDLQMTIKEAVGIKIEIESNVFGGKDTLTIENFTYDKAGNLLEATGTIERETGLGKIPVDWTYAKANSEAFAAAANDLKEHTQNVPELAARLKEATGVYIEKSKDNEVRRVFLGKANAEGQSVPLMVETRDVDGNWKLLAYDATTKPNGDVTGQIYARRDKGSKADQQYKQIGTFVDGGITNSMLLAQKGIQFGTSIDLKNQTESTRSMAETKRVHVEKDLNGNLMREIGMKADGQLAYVADLGKKSLIVFSKSGPQKYSIRAEKDKVVVVAKERVTKKDLQALMFSLPHMGAADTSSVVQKAVLKQDKAVDKTKVLAKVVAQEKAMVNAGLKQDLKKKEAQGAQDKKTVFVSSYEGLTFQNNQEIPTRFDEALQKYVIDWDLVPVETVMSVNSYTTIPGVGQVWTGTFQFDGINSEGAKRFSFAFGSLYQLEGDKKASYVLNQFGRPELMEAEVNGDQVRLGVRSLQVGASELRAAGIKPRNLFSTQTPPDGVEFDAKIDNGAVVISDHVSYGVAVLASKHGDAKAMVLMKPTKDGILIVGGAEGKAFLPENNHIPQKGDADEKATPHATTPGQFTIDRKVENGYVIHGQAIPFTENGVLLTPGTTFKLQPGVIFNHQGWEYQNTGKVSSQFFFTGDEVVLSVGGTSHQLGTRDWFIGLPYVEIDHGSKEGSFNYSKEHYSVSKAQFHLNSDGTTVTKILTSYGGTIGELWSTRKGDLGIVGLTTGKVIIFSLQEGQATEKLSLLDRTSSLLETPVPYLTNIGNKVNRVATGLIGAPAVIGNAVIGLFGFHDEALERGIEILQVKQYESDLGVEMSLYRIEAEKADLKNADHFGYGGQFARRVTHGFLGWTEAISNIMGKHRLETYTNSSGKEYLSFAAETILESQKTYWTAVAMGAVAKSVYVVGGTGLAKGYTVLYEAHQLLEAYQKSDAENFSGKLADVVGEMGPQGIFDKTKAVARTVGGKLNPSMNATVVEKGRARPETIKDRFNEVRPKLDKELTAEAIDEFLPYSGKHLNSEAEISHQSAERFLSDIDQKNRRDGIHFLNTDEHAGSVLELKGKKGQELFTTNNMAKMSEAAARTEKGVTLVINDDTIAKSIGKEHLKYLDVNVLRDFKQELKQEVVYSKEIIGKFDLALEKIDTKTTELKASDVKVTSEIKGLKTKRENLAQLIDQVSNGEMKIDAAMKRAQSIVGRKLELVKAYDEIVAKGDLPQKLDFNERALRTLRREADSMQANLQEAYVRGNAVDDQLWNLDQAKTKLTTEKAKGHEHIDRLTELSAVVRDSINERKTQIKTSTESKLRIALGENAGRATDMLTGIKTDPIQRFHPRMVTDLEPNFTLGDLSRISKQNPGTELCLRVVSEKGLSSKQTYSADRPVVMVIKASDLLKDGSNIFGEKATISHMLKEVGYLNKDIATAIEKKIQYRIVLFEVDKSKVIAKSATWNEVGDMMRADPVMGALFHFYKIDKSVNEVVADLKAGIQNPIYDELRKDLEERYALNPLFNGSGYTMAEDGSRGLKEYFLMPRYEDQMQTRKWERSQMRERAIVPLRPW